MKLNPGVTIKNITALFLAFFVMHMVFSLQSSFTRYLLEDHYHIPEDERAELAGNLGAAA